jgi:hypothetical protein
LSSVVVDEASLRCNLDVSRYAFVIEAVPLFLGQVLRKTTVGPVASPLAQTIGPFVTNLKLLGNNLASSILKRSLWGSLIGVQTLRVEAGTLLCAQKILNFSLDNGLPGCP